MKLGRKSGHGMRALGEEKWRVRFLKYIISRCKILKQTNNSNNINNKKKQKLSVYKLCPAVAPKLGLLEEALEAFSIHKGFYTNTDSSRVDIEIQGPCFNIALARYEG